MHKPQFLKFIVAVIAGLLLAQPAPADSPKAERYETLVHSVWSAFQCSVLAEKSRNPAEQKRLFRFGYDQGLKVIAALESGAAGAKELGSDAPFSMLLLLQGPTPDFMLGRIFEVALRSALENAYTTDDYYSTDETQESIATAEFWKRNCKLIGT